MSTMSHDGDRAFTEVFGPDDVADLRRRLSRGRFWRLLNARDTAWRLLRGARAAMARFAGRAVRALHAGTALATAGRGGSHVARAAAPVTRLVRAAGVTPLLVAAAAAGPVRRVITLGMRWTVRHTRRAIRFIARRVGQGLRAFGPGGVRLAARVRAGGRQLVLQVLSRTAWLWMPVSGLLQYRGLVYEAAGAWGRQKAIRGLLRHLLPGRWARLTGALTLILLLPATAWRRLVALLSAIRPQPEPPTPTSATRPAGGVRVRLIRPAREAVSTPSAVAADGLPDEGGTDEVAGKPGTALEAQTGHSIPRATREYYARREARRHDTGSTGSYPAKKRTHPGA